MIRILLNSPSYLSGLSPLNDSRAKHLAGKKVSDLSDDELRALAEILCQLQGICDTDGLIQGNRQQSD